jgi:RNA recognition motif-containing protein
LIIYCFLFIHNLIFFQMNIFVAKLNFRTQSEDLRETFEAFGEVESAKVIMDHETGKSRGFGFVEMLNEDEGQAAIDALNETDLDGNTIVVKKAEPRKTGGGGGGGFNSRPPRSGGDYRPRDNYGSRDGGGGGGYGGGGNRDRGNRDGGGGYGGGGNRRNNY